jgi:exopolysaccharide production protein ExoQ
MSLFLASIVCIVGVAGLFYLDRDKSLTTSGALWLPVIWLWIVGSRSASEWLGLTPSGHGVNQQLEGSPVDAVVFLVLLVAAVVVLLRRKRRTVAVLKMSAPAVIYFVYCLLSTLWAPYPGVAFKRWIKDVGDLAMVLVVVTESEPISALQRLFSRVGFILLPASILLIKYSDLGHQIDVYGNLTRTGVTTNKNTLGLVTYVISLGTVWSVSVILRDGRPRNRGRRLLARGTLLVLGLALLSVANSATSIACLALGTVLIIATGLSSIRRRPNAVHALVLTALLVGGLTMLFGGQGSVVHALGRKSDFTGRTDIWKAVIPLARNPLIGAGFESFWIEPGLSGELALALPGWGIQHLNEAHNGYIEMYLNLGWVGVCLLALILIGGYRRAVGAFRGNSAIGSLALAYVATAAIYSITEAGFRMMTPSWISLLLAVVAAGGTAAGVVGSVAPKLRGARTGRGTGRSTDQALALEPFGRNS